MSTENILQTMNDGVFIKKSWSYQNGCVFPLFSRNRKTATYDIRKSLFWKVGHLGLEPRTSRL